MRVSSRALFEINGNAIADDMAMYAAQIREHIESKNNYAPSPWALDDLMTRYRTWYESRRYK